MLIEKTFLCAVWKWIHAIFTWMFAFSRLAHFWVFLHRQKKKKKSSTLWRQNKILQHVVSVHLDHTCMTQKLLNLIIIGGCLKFTVANLRSVGSMACWALGGSRLVHGSRACTLPPSEGEQKLQALDESFLQPDCLPLPCCRGTRVG